MKYPPFYGGIFIVCGLYFDNDTAFVSSFNLNKIPVSVRFLIPFQFFDKQNGLFDTVITEKYEFCKDFYKIPL